MFTSLEGSYSPLEGWMLPRRHTNATKAHPIFPLIYHHGGDSQTLAVDLKGGNQTIINAKAVIIMVDSSLKYFYPPRSLQPSRVTRSRGKCSILAQITSLSSQKREGSGSING